MLLKVLHASATKVTLTDPSVFLLLLFCLFVFYCLPIVYHHYRIPNLRQGALCSAV